jgi:hypothetical protein
MLFIRRDHDNNQTHSRTKRGVGTEQRRLSKYVDASTRQSTVKNWDVLWRRKECQTPVGNQKGEIHSLILSHLLFESSNI